MKRIASILLIFIFIFTLTACIAQRKNFNRNNLTFISTDENVKTLKDLSYDIKNHKVGRVHLLENNEYVPYLVVSDDYNGDCLLLREKIMTEKLPYFGENFKTDEEFMEAYYGNSFIDYYLNNKFLKDLSDNISKNIVNKKIDVFNSSKFNKKINGIDRKTLTSINRKVFLLSAAELGKKDREKKEGSPIPFFTSDAFSKIGRCSMREASDENGYSCTWSLRTINPLNDLTTSMVGGNIDVDGNFKKFGQVVKDDQPGVGGSFTKGPYNGDGVYKRAENGIRPAFCLRKDFPVIKVKDDKGKEIFALEEKQKENTTQIPKIRTLNQLAFKKNRNINKIYLKEKNEFVPFLVLSKYENTDKILLVREDTLPIDINSKNDNTNNEFGYINSEIDNYLENIYFKEYLANYKNIIAQTEIDVEDQNKNISKIPRHVFSLSAEEVCGGTELYMNKLGINQEYFKNPKNRIVQNANYKEDWALRDFIDRSPTIINYKGSIRNYVGLWNLDKIYVRPSFCIDSNIRVFKENDKYYIDTKKHLQ